MPSRLYKTDKEQLSAEGKLIVSSTDDAKFQHKVEPVNLVLGGMTPSALSEFVCESKNTITLRVKSADEKGLMLFEPRSIQDVRQSFLRKTSHL